MAKKAATPSYPALLRVAHRAKPLHDLLQAAIDAGAPLQLAHNGTAGESEDASAIDASLLVEHDAISPPPPQPGTSYAGLTPAQRGAFIAWSRHPENPAPVAYQQLFLANVEAQLLDGMAHTWAMEKLEALGTETLWANNPSLHRTYLFACWLLQDGPRLAQWIGTRALPSDLLGVALGQQALLNTPLTPQELGIAIERWQLGARLPTDLLKLRLDSLTSILGQPPLAYALSKLDPTTSAPRPWRTSHRGLRILMPQPDLRPVLEDNLRDLLAVADVHEDHDEPVGILAALDTSQPAAPAEETQQPSLEELGWRLILEFGSNRSEYMEYVLIQAQKLPGYSQIMDEDRRIVYRIIFRKSEMRRFWRLWDYVHGWTSTRVYLNGEELEKWKVWPYSQYLR